MGLLESCQNWSLVTVSGTSNGEMTNCKIFFRMEVEGGLPKTYTGFGKSPLVSLELKLIHIQ